MLPIFLDLFLDQRLAGQVGRKGLGLVRFRLRLRVGFRRGLSLGFGFGLGLRLGLKLRLFLQLRDSLRLRALLFWLSRGALLRRWGDAARSLNLNLPGLPLHPPLLPLPDHTPSLALRFTPPIRWRLAHPSSTQTPLVRINPKKSNRRHKSKRHLRLPLIR